MPLKNKTKIYLSLEDKLLEFIEQESKILGITKSKYINNILLEEYKLQEKRKINKIIEGDINRDLE